MGLSAFSINTVHGNLAKGQKPNGSWSQVTKYYMYMLNKRQVGSHQCQVASFFKVETEEGCEKDIEVARQIAASTPSFLDEDSNMSTDMSATNIITEPFLPVDENTQEPILKSKINQEENHVEPMEKDNGSIENSVVTSLLPENDRNGEDPEDDLE